MVGYYIAPHDASTLESAVAAIGHMYRGAYTLVSRDFNTDLELMDSKKCDQAIAAAMETEILEDMTEQLFSCKLPWAQDGQTWSMFCCVQYVSYQTYCILGTDHRMFQNVAIRYPRHKTDHCMVLGCLSGMNMTEHQCYLGLRKRLPIYPPKRLFHKDKLFNYLRQAVPKTLA